MPRMTPEEMAAAELALEALLEARLEAVTARLQNLHTQSNKLFAETQALSSVFQAKAVRVYRIEDLILRLQGKPGLSESVLQNGSRSRLGLDGSDKQLDDFKMGVKTLRKKFQAAGAVASTVGWWRHLKDKVAAAEAARDLLPRTGAPSATAPSVGDAPSELRIDTTHSITPPRAKSPTGVPLSVAGIAASAAGGLGRSASTRKNALALQSIFSSPPPSSPSKPAHHHYITSPTSERANPALGLYSPPLSPKPPAPSNSLMRGLSLRSG